MTGEHEMTRDECLEILKSMTITFMNTIAKTLGLSESMRTITQGICWKSLGKNQFRWSNSKTELN